VAKYKKILLAVDFGAESESIVERAMQVVQDNGAELLLIHVNEPIVTVYQTGGMAGWSTQAVSLDEEIRKISEEKMDALSSRLGIPADNCFLPYGKASQEIKRVAQEQDVDLIIMGTHGRHGLGLLLGSTATGVLHGASCDVLAIRTGSS